MTPEERARKYREMEPLLLWEKKKEERGMNSAQPYTKNEWLKLMHYKNEKGHLGTREIARLEATIEQGFATVSDDDCAHEWGPWSPVPAFMASMEQERRCEKCGWIERREIPVMEDYEE